MSRLRKECEHGRYDAHGMSPYGKPSPGRPTSCPGGTPPDTFDLITALEDDGWIVPPLGFDYFKQDQVEESPMAEQCGTCGGEGYIEHIHSGLDICATCRGSGKVEKSGP